MSGFKIGDIVRDKLTRELYKVLDVDSEGKELRLVNTDDSGRPGWYFDTGFEFVHSSEQFKAAYEPDDGTLSDEQMSSIKKASSATELPESAFTEKLFNEPSLIDNTLQERGKRYGSFNDLAKISQDLKEVMRATPGWSQLTASQKEALEMVQHKVARMLNGDPTYEDNAVDIVGYSTLMMKNMQGDLSI